MKELDEHGQPLNKNFNSRRLTTRSIDELIGLCKGIQADGALHHSEAVFLAKWLESSREVIDIWPANILAERVEFIFKDGKIDDKEKKNLLKLLSEITGYKPNHEIIDTSTGEVIDNLTRVATLLPLDKPAPSIVFENKIFCMTGRFFYGARRSCENEIMERGGKVHPTITRDTDYLVIGLLGSTDWKHSTHGMKIKYAADLKRKGNKIAIVSEEHWVKYLKY